jgi:tRNA G18 (ribose-2'-O)-methylase SpoU
MSRFNTILLLGAGRLITCLSLFHQNLSIGTRSSWKIATNIQKTSQESPKAHSQFTSFATSNDFSDSIKFNGDNVLSKAERELREVALHRHLTNLGIDAEDLRDAVQKAATAMVGNDPYYGKSAIKAYRTFIYPRPSKVDSVRGEDIEVAACRCARQIDFLAKRNRSHQAEWVRHHDQSDGVMTDRKLFPLVIVLDNVRSAFNVGSIFRTADACGCSMVITTGITPTPFGSGREKLAKSALQADRVVPSKHFTTTKEAIQYLRDEHSGFCLVGMETTEKSQCYTKEFYPGQGEFTVNGKFPEHGTVLILGNEVTGVDTEILPLLDKIVEIPMFGTKNSLNIAACAPVVMYEILRQWGAMSDEKQ